MKELLPVIEKIFEIGRSFGLGFPDIHYRKSSQDALSQLASFGLPNRFSHWYFGGIYKNLKIQQDEKLMTILELVINTDPVYAFLLETNSFLENRMVIAHVVGHVDFFENNTWYARSDKDMLNRCEMHARRIRQLGEEFGKEKIDELIASILTVGGSANVFELDEKERQKRILYFLQSNVPVVLRAMRKGDGRWKELSATAELLDMLTRETEYFDLIGRSQIINEGWASFVEFKILEQLLSPSEWLDFTLLFSKRPAHYQIGFALFHKIFAAGGWEKVLEARHYYEDIAFVDEFLDQEQCERLGLYVASADGKEKDFDVRRVKARMIDDKITKGQPQVFVDHYDRKTRAIGMVNMDPDRSLDKTRTEQFLKALHRIWPFEISLVDHDNVFRFSEKGFAAERK